MAAALRRQGAAGEAVSFAELVKETGRIFKGPRYDQHPETAGHRPVLKAAVPWGARQAPAPEA
jgi:hypothetical protein